MHLIVDHSENQENVQLLTEVGEQDLLNMIEGESEVKPKEEVVKRRTGGGKTEERGERRKEIRDRTLFIYGFNYCWCNGCRILLQNL